MYCCFMNDGDGQSLATHNWEEKLIRKRNGSVHLIKKDGCNVCLGQRKGNTGSSIIAQWMGNHRNAKLESLIQETVRKT